MKQVTLQFFGNLQEVLPIQKKGTILTHNFWGTPTVKDTIQSQGVPHSEVDIILVNGHSVAFDTHIQEEDHIEVYPVGFPIQQESLIHLTAETPAERRFICDVHLGSLAKFLRMSGFDTQYRNDLDDDEITYLAEKENRIVLTRDRGILMRNRVIHGHLIRTTDQDEQIIETYNYYKLLPYLSPFTRCMRCNGKLHAVPKEEIVHRLELETVRLFNEFTICSDCRKIYWKGSHYVKMVRLLEKVRDDLK